jgi:hypothetical protein
MGIIFDVLTKTAVVTFRGEVKMLGPFPNRQAAIKASEAFCRLKGWRG